MPIDSSIYQNVKQMEMPSPLESQSRAMNLSQMAMNQVKGARDMQSAEQDQAHKEHLRKASVFGEALDSMSKMSPQERAMTYPKVREQMIQTGILKPQDMPPEHDEGYYRNTLNRYYNTPGYLDIQEKKAQIAKLQADASRKGSDDPLARQMFMAEFREKQAQKRKEDEIRSYSNVGGWKLSDGATPTKADANVFKEGVSDARTLLQSLDEYQQLLKNKGSEYGGKDAQRMESLARDIQMRAKSPAMYALGVLNGQDFEILKDLMDSPTGFWDQAPWSGGRARNKAQQFRDMLTNSINAKAKTYGFQPTEEWMGVAAGNPPKKEKGPNWGNPEANAAGDMAPPAFKPPPPGMIQMSFPGGVVKNIPESLKGDAIKNGGTVVTK